MDNLSQVIKHLEDALAILKGQPKPEVVKSNDEMQRQVFDNLKALLDSNEWPHAVEPHLICKTSSFEDKIERASGILDVVVGHDLEGQSFLDFGCGEGHVSVKALEQKPKCSIGYDIVEPSEKIRPWNEPDNNLLLTTNFELVRQYAPYNVILLYDVLDHIEGEEIKETMQRVRSLCNGDTNIIVRCHPFCSRHGGHLYNQINKAFVHLVFTEKELERMDYKLPPSKKIIHPKAYRSIFGEYGFKIISQSSEKAPVENFFKEKQIVKNRILKQYADANITELPVIQMEHTFLDFVLGL